MLEARQSQFLNILLPFAASRTIRLRLSFNIDGARRAIASADHQRCYYIRASRAYLQLYNWVYNRIYGWSRTLDFWGLDKNVYGVFLVVVNEVDPMEKKLQ